MHGVLADAGNHRISENHHENIGYARVSTRDQNPELQLDALSAAGCDRIFTEKASDAQRDRPELQAALDYMREGDTLVVWRLDRLARSLNQLITTVEDLEARGIGFRSLTEAVDTTTNGGRVGGAPPARFRLVHRAAPW